MSQNSVALRALFLAAPVASISYADPANPSVVHTLADWLNVAQKFDVLLAAVNDLSVGVQAGLTVPTGIIQSDKLFQEVMQGVEFTSTMGIDQIDKIQRYMGNSPNQFWDYNNTGAHETMLELLPASSYPQCRARYLAAATRPGTINESQFGGALSPEDIDHAIAGI